MTNISKKLWEKHMFMSMNRILCQKPGFCVKKRLIEKVDLLKKSTFFERGIFEKHGNF